MDFANTMNTMIYSVCYLRSTRRKTPSDTTDSMGAPRDLLSQNFWIHPEQNQVREITVWCRVPSKIWKCFWWKRSLEFRIVCRTLLIQNRLFLLVVTFTVILVWEIKNVLYVVFLLDSLLQYMPKDALMQCFCGYFIVYVLSS